MPEIDSWVSVVLLAVSGIVTYFFGDKAWEKVKAVYEWIKSFFVKGVDEFKLKKTDDDNLLEAVQHWCELKKFCKCPESAKTLTELWKHLQPQFPEVDADVNEEDKVSDK